MTLQKAKQELKTGIASYLLRTEGGNYVLQQEEKLPFYLKGPVGIGKAKIVRQIAEELGIGLVSTSVMQYTIQTILDEVQNKYEQGEQEGILLLDELISASELLVTSLLPFLQKNNIGNELLPDGWVVVLCTNSAVYECIKKQFGTVVLEQMRVLDVEFHVKEFLDYGEKTGIHKLILEYLNLHKKYTYCSYSETEFVTPKEWEKLSQCITIYEQMKQKITKELVLQYIKSEEIAYSFSLFYVMFQNKFPENMFADILAGTDMQRYLHFVSDFNTVTKWEVLTQLISMLIESSKQYDVEYNAYVAFRNTYQYLVNKQQRIPDTWNFYDIVCTRAKGKQSFPERMEKEVFGEVSVSKAERKLYEGFLERLEVYRMGKQINNMICNIALETQVENMTVLHIMEEYIACVTNQLQEKMEGTNQGIINTLVFLQRMEKNEENYADLFVEKTAKVQSILNVVSFCKNQIYVKTLAELNVE